MKCTTAFREIMFCVMIFEALPLLPFPVIVGPLLIPLVRLMEVLPPSSIVNGPSSISGEKILPDDMW